MGRKGGIGRLADLGDKAKRKRKTIGTAIGARGQNPANAFLARFKERVAAKQAEEQQREVVRGQLRERFKGQDTRGSILGRLFGV